MNPIKKAKLDELHAKVMRELTGAIDDGETRITLQMATGMGKTNVASHLAMLSYLLKGKKIFIITHNWALIHQFFNRLNSLYPKFNFKKHTAYLASPGNPGVQDLKKAGVKGYHEEEVEVDDIKIVLTTYQSLERVVRIGERYTLYKKLKKLDPGLIIIDEAHWGKNGTTEKKIFNFFEKRFKDSLHLGLTATPKVRRNWIKVGNLYFSDMVEAGLLARPKEKLFPVKSNVRLRFDSTGMITNENEVLHDKIRNAFIAEKIFSERERVGKTIVFAGDIIQANALAFLLKKKGLSVVPIHSGVSRPSDSIHAFSQGAYDIAVTVNMMAEGLDIPDITTVVIARPVTSEIMFAQMVGRGSRITENKSEFTLLDFHDVTEQPGHQEHLFHYKDYYNNNKSDSVQATPRQTSTRKRPKLTQHNTEYNSQIMTLIYGPKDSLYYPVLHGLKIDAEQTFGIEFELHKKNVDLSSKSDWMKAAKPLHDFLVSLLGKENAGEKPFYDHVKSIDYSRWNVVYDGSCGFEIVSPILKGASGFEEVVDVLSGLRLQNILKKNGFEVNYLTGTHVHLGWKYKDPLKVRDILKLVYKYEPAFHSLISPSRIKSSSGTINDYCAPVRSEFSLKEIEAIDTMSALNTFFGSHEDRYRSLNLTRYNKKISTVEVRSHNGTLSEKKILTWVALWMNCINAIERLKKDELTDVKYSKKYFPECKKEDDIIAFCENVFDLNSVNASMLSSLHSRRLELLQSRPWQDVHGPEKAEELQGYWERNFKQSFIIKTNKECEYSNKFEENIFQLSSIPHDLQIKTAKHIIEKNSLMIKPPQLLKSMNDNLLLLCLDGHEITATAGLKKSSYKFLQNVKDALAVKKNYLDKGLDGSKLIEKFERNLAIEKGWATNQGNKKDFKNLNLILEDYFQLLFPVSSGHFLFSTHVEGNEAGSRYLMNGGMRPALKMKSPFSDNQLIVYLKYF